MDGSTRSMSFYHDISGCVMRSHHITVSKRNNLTTSITLLDELPAIRTTIVFSKPFVFMYHENVSLLQKWPVLCAVSLSSCIIYVKFASRKYRQDFSM